MYHTSLARLAPTQLNYTPRSHTYSHTLLAHLTRTPYSHTLLAHLIRTPYSHTLLARLTWPCINELYLIYHTPGPPYTNKHTSSHNTPPRVVLVFTIYINIIIITH